ncbi:hypothetical protein IFO70_31965 [Phormidium tenue FACHB-886]|nr:hypothetical protein [Phormidium tenue FACHB-886]
MSTSALFKWRHFLPEIILLNARLRGWRIADAYFATGVKRISSQTSYRCCFRNITGV